MDVSDPTTSNHSRTPEDYPRNRPSHEWAIVAMQLAWDALKDLLADGEADANLRKDAAGMLYTLNGYLDLLENKGFIWSDPRDRLVDELTARAAAAIAAYDPAAEWRAIHREGLVLLGDRSLEEVEATRANERAETEALPVPMLVTSPAPAQACSCQD
jgi:hypothetical protein